MAYPVSSTLASMFKPYQSKNYFTQALRQGQESAIAFADLVSFENALRADRRLRDEDKLRRWRARVRWQELNERQRRLKFYQMQEAERRMLGERAICCDCSCDCVCISANAAIVRPRSVILLRQAIQRAAAHERHARSPTSASGPSYSPNAAPARSPISLCARPAAPAEPGSCRGDGETARAGDEQLVEVARWARPYARPGQQDQAEHRAEDGADARSVAGS